MQFSLQRLVAQTLAEAEHRVKLAEEENQEKKEEKEKGSPAKPASSSNESTAPERNEEGVSEKTATAFIDKLANAVEYLNNNYFSKKAAGTSETVGAGKGTGALETNLGNPTPGEQSEVFGQAAHNQPPMSPGSDVKSPGQTNPATALETDINSPPGGSESWENKDVEKQGGVSDVAKKGANILLGAGKRGKELLTGAKLKTLETSRTMGAGPAANVAKERAKVWGARAGAGAVGTAAIAKAVSAARSKKDGTKEAQVSRIMEIMQKMAEDAIDPAHIGAAVTNPHQSSPDGVSQSGEGTPSLPGEASKQEALVGSNQAAIDYTKQQAKAVPKARMGEVLDELAQKKSTDPVLHQNLDATADAGVKISSVQARAAGLALLTKIAQEGAQEDATPEQKERAQKLQALLQAKEKESQGLGASESNSPLGGGY